MIFIGKDRKSFDKIMMDRPHFGTQKIVGELLNNCTADELVKKLQSKR